jgi:hypothetical protein
LTRGAASQKREQKLERHLEEETTIETKTTSSKFLLDAGRRFTEAARLIAPRFGTVDARVRRDLY